jgi:uncharacterized protein YndB with AHSA1/START domain
MQIDFDININRPPADVFGYLTDVSKLPQWQSGIISAQWETEKGPGARARAVRDFRGQQQETELQVTKYDQDRRFAINTSSGPIAFSLEYTLQPTDGGNGTHLMVYAEGEASGVAKIAGPLMSRKIEKQLKSDFQVMKQNVEAGG